MQKIYSERMGVVDKVRFAVAGCGFIGRLHAGVIASLEGVSVTAVMDTDAGAAGELARQYGCRWYDNAEDMLGDPNVDAVAICLPSGLHAGLTIQAARAGKHVICEKPMDVSTEQAEKMTAACRENQVRFSVIMQHRFDRPVLLLKKAIAKGLMGRLLWGASRTIWYRDDQYYSSPWRGTWEYDGGGALMCQSIHYIDLLLHIMGNARSVSGKCRTLGHPQIETEDVGVADVEFENGALGTIEGTTASYPGLYAELAIFGDRGTVIIRNDVLSFYQFKDGPQPEFELALNPAGAAQLHTGPEIPSDSHCRQYEDFIEAVRTGGEPTVTGEEAIKSLKLIRAIYQSSDEKREIYM